MNFSQKLIENFTVYGLPILLVVLAIGTMFLPTYMIMSKKSIQKKWIIILATIIYCSLILLGLFYLITYLIFGSWPQLLLIVTAFVIYFFCLWKIYQRWTIRKKDVFDSMIKMIFWLLISWTILGSTILIMHLTRNKISMGI